MSYLYPRLLVGQARPLHEQHRNLMIQDLTERAGTSHDSAVYIATGGDRIPEDALRQLREQVVDLAKQAGFPGESNRGLRAAFDIRLAAVLHSQMNVVPAEAASGDIWAFLALVLLPDVSYWRYPRPPGDRVLGTDITRHVWGRLWWRAHLLALPQRVERYRLLDTFGEAAFDQIFARRRSIGGSRAIVRTLAEVWPSVERGGVAERDVLIDVLKRLSRWG